MSQSSSVNVVVKTGEMGSNYNISGGNQGAVGDQAQASDFVQQSLANERQSLAQAASEIQQLLKALEQSNPTVTDSEKIAYLNDETSTGFKRRTVGALKAAGETAIDEFIDFPYIKIVKALVTGWMYPE